MRHAATPLQLALGVLQYWATRAKSGPWLDHRETVGATMNARTEEEMWAALDKLLPIARQAAEQSPHRWKLHNEIQIGEAERWMSRAREDNTPLEF